MARIVFQAGSRHTAYILFSKGRASLRATCIVPQLLALTCPSRAAYSQTLRSYQTFADLTQQECHGP